MKDKRMRDGMEKWATAGAELLRADPDTYRAILEVLRLRLNLKRTRTVRKIDRR